MVNQGETITLESTVDKDTKTFLGVLAGVAGFGLLVYLATGRREKNSSFIPDAIEDRIDKVVAWLDEKFGKRWVDQGLDMIQSSLFGSLPKPLALLGDAIYQAERVGTQQGWSGPQKRNYARSRA